MNEKINAAPAETASQMNQGNNIKSTKTMEENEILKKVEERRAVVNRHHAISANDAKPLSEAMLKGRASESELLNSQFSWKSPLPIHSRPSPLEYPINSLPKLIREAVIEVQRVTQAPTTIVASSAICALATACQGLIDVQRDDHLSGPTSLYFVILGDSGERKSTVDSFFSKPLKDFHRKSIEDGADELNVYRAELETWKAKCEGLTTQIRTINSGKKKNGDVDVAELEKQLAELFKNEPVRPLIPNLLVLDITTEKLTHQLAREWPSCALVSAEGGLVFGGRSFSKDNQLATFAAFNALWSDEPLRTSRKTSESFEISGARLSMSLFVQSEIFDSYRTTNDMTRSIGFLARCLFAFPESTQGQRFYRKSTRHLQALEAFSEHILKLLNIQPDIENHRLIPKSIPLDDEAKTCWIKFHDEIEGKLGRGKEFEYLRDFGSKAAEIASRLAAIFQMSEGFPIQSISLKNMESGCAIMRWHLSEIQRYFGNLSPSEVRTLSESEKLDRWLVDHCCKNSVGVVDRTFILQNGPSRLRRKEKLAPPLNALCERWRVRLIDKGRRIEINPALLSEDES